MLTKSITKLCIAGCVIGAITLLTVNISRAMNQEKSQFNSLIQNDYGTSPKLDCKDGSLVEKQNGVTRRVVNDQRKQIRC